MIVDGHNVLSNHKIAGEFKNNNKNKPLKKDADKETNVLFFALVKVKHWACDAKGHGGPDCKK